MSTLNFQDQDLRNRSFRCQSLQGANFKGADLRGCDFSYAQLRAINLEQAKLGFTLQQILVTLVTAFIITILAIHANSYMLFGSLGRTFKDPGWSYIVTLLLFLAISGAATGIRVWLHPRSRHYHRSQLISGILSATLLGFFYGGIGTDQDPLVASISAVGTGSMVILLEWANSKIRLNDRPLLAAMTLVGTLNAYTCALLIGSWAIALLAVWQPVPGLIGVSLSLSYSGLTINGLMLSFQDLKQSMGTCFRGTIR